MDSVGLAIRFLSIFTTSMVIGVDQPAKLLCVVACILTWHWMSVMDAREALIDLRKKLVRENYCNKP